jgi:NADH-quinone oxidoreductase subunit C
MGPEEIAAVFLDLGAVRSEAGSDPATRGIHVDATLPRERLRQAVQALRDRGFLIVEVTAVDTAPEMMVVYHFNHPAGGCRVALRILVDRESPRVESIHAIYPGANWHERETREFLGVVFEGHPDLTPLILPDDLGDLTPLRKEAKRLKPLGDVLPEFAAKAPET